VEDTAADVDSTAVEGVDTVVAPGVRGGISPRETVRSRTRRKGKREETKARMKASPREALEAEVDPASVEDVDGSAAEDSTVVVVDVVAPVRTRKAIAMMAERETPARVKESLRAKAKEVLAAVEDAAAVVAVGVATPVASTLAAVVLVVVAVAAATAVLLPPTASRRSRSLQFSPAQHQTKKQLLYNILTTSTSTPISTSSLVIYHHLCVQNPTKVSNHKIKMFVNLVGGGSKFYILCLY
jgi:hypothetical protein